MLMMQINRFIKFLVTKLKSITQYNLQIPNLDVISACEDLAAAEYELADDENRNFLLKTIYKKI